jgi:hypothetical protein
LLILKKFIALELHNHHLFPAPPISQDWAKNCNPKAIARVAKYSDCFELTQVIVAENPKLEYKNF